VDVLGLRERQCTDVFSNHPHQFLYESDTVSSDLENRVFQSFVAPSGVENSGRRWSPSVSAIPPMYSEGDADVVSSVSLFLARFACAMARVAAVGATKIVQPPMPGSFHSTSCINVREEKQCVG